MADSDTTIRELRDEIRAEFRAISKRLDRLESHATQQRKETRAVREGIAWNVLINDLIYFGACLLTVATITSAEYVKAEVCPEIPAWGRAIIPFNFCDGGAGSKQAQAPEDAQIKAFLDAIAWAEGTSGENGYSIQFTGATFADKSKHPREVKCSTAQNGDRLCSDAAGRYQFLSTTWDGYASSLNLVDFSPESQDKAAAQILKENGIPALLAEGKVAEAFCKVGGVWASLPCNSYGQPQKDAADLIARYEEALQKYSAQSGEGRSVGNGSWINPVPSATFTSGFGFRNHPIKNFRSCHYGIDLAAANGTPIMAAKAGSVAFAGWDNSGFGNLVILHHDDGSKSLYGHNSEIKVQQGQRVEQGDIISLMGSTGNSTGPHLHFEVDLGRGKVDPRPLIPGVRGEQSFGQIDNSKGCEPRNIN